MLDPENEVIFGLYHNQFWELDLSDPINNYRAWNIQYEIDKHGVCCANNQIKWDGKSKLYFFEGGDNNRFGCFDRHEKQIIWSKGITDVKGKFPAIRKLEVHDDNVYVLDNRNVLHFFKCN